MTSIDDVEMLEDTVGQRPLGVMMKSIDELDDHCRAVIDRSTAAVVCFRTSDGSMRARLVGGPPGFAWERPDLLRVDVSGASGPVGTVLLTPGWKETLRVNGTLDDGIEVDEALLHCGKAMIRSQLWSPAEDRGDDTIGSGSALDAAAIDFLTASPFAVIGSCDAAGNGDASPKGDPPGFVQVIDDRTIAVPDRPGNRRTDTFHNLVEDPAVAVLALVPGDDRTLSIAGRGTLSTDADLLSTMVVKGKTPTLALVVEIDHVELERGAVAAADLWNPTHHVTRDDLPRATQMWTDHVKANETKGVAATALRLGANERMLRVAIDRDYDNNLY